MIPLICEVVADEERDDDQVGLHQLILELPEAQLEPGADAGNAQREDLGRDPPPVERLFEARAQLAVARVLAEDGDENERIERALTRCEELIASTGARRFTEEVLELRERASAPGPTR